MGTVHTAGKRHEHHSPKGRDKGTSHTGETCTLFTQRERDNDINHIEGEETRTSFARGTTVTDSI